MAQVESGYTHTPTTDPRLNLIHNELQALLQLVDVECDGRPVQVTGMRLKRLDRWRDQPVIDALDAVGAISGACNCQCIFCFERGHPFAQDDSVLSLQEAVTRLRYYDESDGKTLFSPARVFKEPFVNPEALAILRLARQRSPEKVFWLTSNGALLDEETVARLAELMPVMVKLSLNSADPQQRIQLMGSGSRPAEALHVPERLMRHGIPYVGSLVAWPGLLQDDLAATLRYLDEFKPYALRVRLPLYHAYLYPEPPFGPDLWDEVIAFCRQVAPTLASPLYVEPSPYWITPIVPEVDGVIRNSPAARAGVCTGDRLLSIAGQAVSSRGQAVGLLASHREQDGAPLELIVHRPGEPDTRRLQLHLGDGCYPYHPKIHSPGERYGVLLLEDLNISHLERVRELMQAHNSRRAMLFVPPILAPLVQILAENLPDWQAFLADRTLVVETLESTLVGGNFTLMDGRLIEDFIAQIERSHNRAGMLPDLILIPNAFGNPWGIDHLQRSYKEIERRYGIPVELIEWPILYGRDV